MSPNRIRILDAAARVYAATGYRGATTRRIAEEAGVNEVTIFRYFGSKSALIDEAMRCRTAAGDNEIPPLPRHPENPERELTAWCNGRLAHLRSSRSFIRKAMAELEERPEAGPCMAAGPECAARELRGYVRRLCDAGLAGKARGAALSEAESHAAATMLMSALFGDAMGREMMPGMYPKAERAASMYVRGFLRAIGCAPDSTPRRANARKVAGNHGTRSSRTSKRS